MLGIDDILGVCNIFCRLCWLVSRMPVIVLSLLDVFCHGSIEDLDDMIFLLRIFDWYGQSGRKEERPTDEETDAVIHG